MQTDQLTTKAANNPYNELQFIAVDGNRLYLCSDVVERFSLCEADVEDIPPQYKVALPEGMSVWAADCLLTEVGMALLSIKSPHPHAKELIEEAFLDFFGW